MKTRWMLFMGLVLALALVAGCSPSGERSAPAGCPRVTRDTRLLVDQEHGYCALYLAEYESARHDDGGSTVYVGSLLNVSDPRLNLAVEDAAGRTAADAADEVLADVRAALPDMPVQRSETTVDGVTAVVLDGLPGQEITRQVLIVHKGRLYRLVFMPADPAMGDAHVRMQSLYATVMGSWHFID